MKLKWTKKKPTKPGWYWWKRLCCEVEMVEIFEQIPSGILMHRELDEPVESVADAEPQCLWAGPIPEPEDK